MITIDSKIELFNKMIRDKSISEASAILTSLNQKYAQIIDEMDSKLTVQRSEHLEKVEFKMIEQSQKNLAKAKTEASHQIMIKRKEILNHLKETLYDEVQKETQTEGYRKYLIQKLRAELSSLSKNTQTTQITIMANESDVELIRANFSQLDLQNGRQDLQIERQLIGGFYLVINQVVLFDYSLNHEIEALEPQLGCMIRQLFETTEEACDEGK